MSLSLTFDNAYYDKKVKELNSICNTIDSDNNMLYWDVNVNGTEIIIHIDINNIIANSLAGFTIETGLLYPNNIFIKSLVKNITPNMKKVTFLIDKIKPQKNIVFYIKLVHVRNFTVVLSNVTINNTTMNDTTQDIINNRMANPIYTRGIVDIINPVYMYKEMSIIENKKDMLAMITFPAGYFGFIYENKQIMMSISNAHIKNDVIELGPNAIHIDQGNCDNIAVNYHIRVGYRYGFMVKNIIENNVSIISCYFVDLGPSSTTPTSVKWLYIGTIKHHKINSFALNNTQSILISSYKHLNATDGQLYRRSIMMGNTWASMDGNKWVPSDLEEVEIVNNSNSSAKILDEKNGLISVSVGGKINMDSMILTLDRRVYKNILKIPSHLKKL